MTAWLVLSTSMLIFSNKAGITLAEVENEHGEEAVENTCYNEQSIEYKDLAKFIESESLGTCLLPDNI